MTDFFVFLIKQILGEIIIFNYGVFIFYLYYKLIGENCTFKEISWGKKIKNRSIEIGVVGLIGFFITIVAIFYILEKIFY
jgi:hypothetical protein